MKAVKLYHTPQLNPVQIKLPGSKSESNRALIISSLGNLSSSIKNLSSATDTVTMKWLLASPEKELDVIDAGTTMRFLTAYLALTSDERILTGSDRMLERPIAILVDALRELGAEIEYLGNEGFPPLLLKPFKGQKQRSILLKGDVSSQYVSALLMIAPSLPKGLKVEIDGELVSRPYVDMTLAIMREYGADSSWLDSSIEVASQRYVGTEYEVESDWSAASYWYSLVSMADKAQITLNGLRKNSYQGDQQISSIMEQIGVQAHFQPDGVTLTKGGPTSAIDLDFSHCPDLAQTVAVACAGLSQSCTLRGIENLAIKETDRISALANELKKIGVDLVSSAAGQWELRGKANFTGDSPLEISTYGDHRMAMAFACLVSRGDLIVSDPDVVNKSYPSFWKHLALAGVTMEFFHS